MGDQRDFLLSSYDYELDKKLIAQEPLEPRHQARMMVVKKKRRALAVPLHLKVWDLLDQLKAGDLLVMNDLSLKSREAPPCLMSNKSP